MVGIRDVRQAQRDRVHLLQMLLQLRHRDGLRSQLSFGLLDKPELVDDVERLSRALPRVLGAGVVARPRGYVASGPP